MAPDWRKWVDGIGLTAQFFARGGVTFDSLDFSDEDRKPLVFRRRVDDLIREFAGHVRGKRVLDLQCGAGEATLSWANLGARATGVDLSDARVASARQKAAEAGIGATYVRADVSRLPFRNGSFDLVYSGGGVIGWLPDVTAWARQIARVLRKGGRFVLFDTHPFLRIIDWTKRRPTLAGDYFDQASRVYGNARKWPVQVETDWKVSDVVNALVDAGLVLRRLEELPFYGRHRAKKRAGLPHRWILVCEKPRRRLSALAGSR